MLGTIPYMAPEQIEGRDADARTDIFALGMILYAMSAGRPRSREAVPRTLAAILAERPAAGCFAPRRRSRQPRSRRQEMPREGSERPLANSHGPSAALGGAGITAAHALATGGQPREGCRSADAAVALALASRWEPLRSGR